METPGAAGPVAGGYRSEEEKRAFLLRAGVIGAFCLVAQVVVPMLAPMIAMPAMMAAGRFQFSRVEASSIADWRGRLVFVEKTDGFGKGRKSLRTMSLDGVVDERLTDLEGHDGSLIEGGGRLWYVCEHRVQSFEDPSTAPVVTEGPGAGFEAAFFAGGALRAAFKTPDGIRFKTLRDGAWSDWFRLESNPGSSGIDAVVPASGRLHLFTKLDGGLYHAAIPEAASGEVKPRWAVAGAGCGAWHPFEENGAVFAVCARRGEGMGQEIAVLREAAGEWKTERVYPFARFAHDLGMIPARGGRERLLVAAGMPGSFVVFAAGDGLVEKARVGSGFPFPKALVALLVLPHLGMVALSFALAWLLDRQVDRYRPAPEGTPSALLRRALAQAADILLVSLPGLAAMYWFFRAMSEGPGPRMMLLQLALMGGQLLWAFACLLAFSYAEGAWGATPGKKLMGLRVVGLDGEPCGFGRALVRNLLKLADGFFNFNVGLLLAALTDTRQRLGDMVAGTRVVRAG